VRRTIFIILIILNTLVLSGAIAWLYVERKFEPAIAVTGSLATLIGLLASMRGKNAEDLAQEIDKHLGEIKDKLRRIEGERLEVQKTQADLMNLGERVEISIKLLSRQFDEYIRKGQKDISDEIVRIKEASKTDSPESLSESQRSLMELIARVSDLKLQNEFINQHRLQLANLTTTLVSKASQLTNDSDLRNFIENRISNYQRIDKELQTGQKRFEIQLEQARKEIANSKQIISENIQRTFKQLG
jgi:hypothetical protein